MTSQNSNTTVSCFYLRDRYLANRKWSIVKTMQDFFVWSQLVFWSDYRFKDLHQSVINTTASSCWHHIFQYDYYFRHNLHSARLDGHVVTIIILASIMPNARQSFQQTSPNDFDAIVLLGLKGNFANIPSSHVEDTPMEVVSLENTKCSMTRWIYMKCFVILILIQSWLGPWFSHMSFKTKNNFSISPFLQVSHYTKIVQFGIPTASRNPECSPFKKIPGNSVWHVGTILTVLTTLITSDVLTEKLISWPTPVFRTVTALKLNLLMFVDINVHAVQLSFIKSLKGPSILTPTTLTSAVHSNQSTPWRKVILAKIILVTILSSIRSIAVHHHRHQQHKYGLDTKPFS